VISLYRGIELGQVQHLGARPGTTNRCRQLALSSRDHHDEEV
jgi:hypothetical protein